MGDPRLANLLGAAALAVHDLVLDRASKQAGVNVRRATALVTLTASPGISLSELGRRVGLTQSAAVRMVDTLEADGLVVRDRDPDNRLSVTLRVTPAGEELTQRVLRVRGRSLADLVDPADHADEQRLSLLLSDLLTRLYRLSGNAQHMCRLCDRSSCDTATEDCPVGAADRRATHPESR